VLGELENPLEEKGSVIHEGGAMGTEKSFKFVKKEVLVPHFHIRTCKENHTP
jgi:hypothetical protein